MSNKTKTLDQKLLEIRKSVPYLPKNASGRNYNFVSHSIVISSIREKMDALNLLLTPNIKDKKVTILPTGSSRMILTELDIDFVWRCADSGEEKIVPFYTQGCDPLEKGVGKALTYAEKYFILRQFNIPTDDLDPDTFQQQIDNLPNYITSEQANELMQATQRLAQLNGIPVGNIINSLGLTSFDRVTVDNFFTIRNQLNIWLKEANNKQNGTQQAPQANNNNMQNNQQNNMPLAQELVNELMNLVNQIANTRKIDPQHVINSLGLNKNFNELTQNEFNAVKERLNSWLSEITNNQPTQQLNNSGNQQQTTGQTSAIPGGQEFVLVRKEQEKAPSGEVIVKLTVEGSEQPIFARSSEVMQQANSLQEGSRFIAQIEQLGNFTFVKTLQPA